MHCASDNDARGLPTSDQSVVGAAIEPISAHAALWLAGRQR